MPAPYNSVLTKPDNLYTNLPRGGGSDGALSKKRGNFHRFSHMGENDVASLGKLRYTGCNLTERERGAWKNIVALCAES